MDGLIDTKLAPPAAIGQMVPRAYALSRLEQALAGHASLVVAPAGYGKTELMSRGFHRCREQGLRVGWISLEPEDAQLESFVAYALAALGQGTSPATQGGPMSRRAAVSALLAASFAASGRCLLFLDDYERLGGALDDFVRLLIERASPRLHLVIASRVQPEFGAAELRTKQLLSEIGTADLRMGFDEAAALLSSRARPLSEGDIALLLGRTEGWPIALRMAGDFVQSHPQAASPLTSFSGRAHDLANYLYDAILRTLPLDEQQALLALSCLPRVCAPLLNVLAQRRDGGALLRRFAQRNVLLDSLDDEGHWYRLHPLLAEFLQQRLAQTDASAAAQIQRHAARWFAQHQLLPEALRAASAAADTALVAELLDRAGGWRLLFDGRAGLLRAHLGDVDEATLLMHPRLAMARAVVLAKSSATWQAAAWLERVRQASAGFSALLQSEAPGFGLHELALEARMTAVAVGWYLDEAPAGGFEADIQALLAQADPATDPLLAGTAHNLLCYEQQCMRRHRAAWDTADRAVAAVQGAGYALHVLYLRFIQLGVLVEQARLPEATALARQLQLQAEQACGPGGDLAAVAEILLAHVLVLQGDAANAAELLERALPQVLEQDAWFDVLWAGHAAAVGLAVLNGDEAAAAAVLDRGQALAERRRLRRLSARLQVHRIELLLPQGRLAHALDLARALDLPSLQLRFKAVDRRVADAAWLTDWRVRCAAAGSAAAPQELAAAAQALADSVETWAAEGSVLLCIEALLLLAQVQRQRGESSACGRALDRALALAVPSQVVLPFIEHGLPLARNLEQALVRSGGRGAPNLRARLLATVLDSLQRLASPKPGRPAFGLSPREAEMAALLRQGLSNKLIGLELGLSEGTVKFHLRNLYAKLGAHGREDALRLLAAPPPGA